MLPLNPQLVRCGETQVLYQGVVFFRSSQYKVISFKFLIRLLYTDNLLYFCFFLGSYLLEVCYTDIKYSINHKYLTFFSFHRCYSSRSHDCKARFQTKGDKILKPFLLHTHSIESYRTKREPKLEY